MAIDLGTELAGRPGGATGSILGSDERRGRRPSCRSTVDDPSTGRAALGPLRGRGGRASCGRPTGLAARVDSTLPVGRRPVVERRPRGRRRPRARLRPRDPVGRAQLCQRAEHRAVGVPCGIMDQLAIAAGVEGHALRIDCTTLEVDARSPCPTASRSSWPTRASSASWPPRAYGARRAECGRPRRASVPCACATPRRRRTHRRPGPAAAGPPRRHRERSGSTPSSPRSRPATCRHAGELMAASHASLRDDFEVSTPALDALVAAPAGHAGHLRRPPHRRRLRRLRGRAVRRRDAGRRAGGVAGPSRRWRLPGRGTQPGRLTARPGRRPPHIRSRSSASSGLELGLGEHALLAQLVELRIWAGIESACPPPPPRPRVALMRSNLRFSLASICL